MVYRYLRINLILPLIVLVSTAPKSVGAFSPVDSLFLLPLHKCPKESSRSRSETQTSETITKKTKTRTTSIWLDSSHDTKTKMETNFFSTISRRNWLNKGILLVSSFGTCTFTPTTAAAAEIDMSNEAITIPVSPPSSLDMKDFVDPSGLFSLRVPTGFFTLRRTAKGDLPDSKTGRGRRGSSIFTAGNMGKAEVVAVERFPTRVLLEENGIEATGDLSSFPAIGNPKAIANLIVLRREKDGQNQGTKVIDSVEVTPDGKELKFRLRTEIDVQKPELLLEQTGLSQLFRITVAKVTLNSNDGNIMAVFASALEQDFTNGVDGPALEDSVNSFQVTNQS